MEFHNSHLKELQQKMDWNTPTTLRVFVANNITADDRQQTTNNIAT